jgi:hypothetical protein
MAQERVYEPRIFEGRVMLPEAGSSCIESFFSSSA